MATALQRFIGDLRRVLYAWPASRVPRATLAGRLANARLFLAIGLLPFLAGLGICAIILAVDPFNLRPWGMAPKLFDGNYPELVTPKLVRAVAREPNDVILIGGSQAMGVTPEEMRKVFGARRATNLAYSLARSPDTGLIMRAAVMTPDLKRLIVELPFTLLDTAQPPAPTGAGAVAVLTGPWYALPDFGDDTARASLARLEGGAFSIPAWQRQASAFLGTQSILDRPGLVAELAEAFDKVPAHRFQDNIAVPCDRFRFLDQAILPVARQAEARGVTLDLYFPPIPIPTYPKMEWSNQGESGQAAFFDQYLSFHRCVVSAIERRGYRHVHVHAIELDGAIVSDLGNYKDSYHLFKPEKFERILDDVRTGRFELKTAQLESYSKRLRDDVAMAYRARRKLRGAPRDAALWQS